MNPFAESAVASAKERALYVRECLSRARDARTVSDARIESGCAMRELHRLIEDLEKAQAVTDLASFLERDHTVPAPPISEIRTAGE